MKINEEALTVELPWDLELDISALQDGRAIAEAVAPLLNISR